jgi:hypothetical protein
MHMGVRLYPNTTNVVRLEKLANVPSGTHARMEEMEKRHAEERANTADWNMYEDGYRQWKEKDSDDAIGTLDAFLTFGWGKFRPVSGIGEDYAGNEPDFIRADLLLAANGINANAHYCEGIHWC